MHLISIKNRPDSEFEKNTFYYSNSSLYLPISFGAVAGLAAGIFSKLIQTRSFSMYDRDNCLSFSSIPWIGPLSEWREGQFRVSFLSDVSFLFFSAAALWIGSRKDDREKMSGCNVMKKMGISLSRIAISPFLFHLSSTVIGKFVFDGIRMPVRLIWHIRISGHGFHHSLLLVQIFHSLQALSTKATPQQLKSVVVLLTTLSLVDLPWVYNTAANCHSLADIVSGCALSAFSCLVTQLYLIPALKWGGTQIQNSASSFFRSFSEPSRSISV